MSPLGCAGSLHLRWAEYAPVNGYGMKAHYEIHHKFKKSFLISFLIYVSCSATSCCLTWESHSPVAVAVGAAMSSGCACRVRANAHWLRAEPLELWARSLYWKKVKGRRAGLASKNSSGPLDQMNTSSSSSVPTGRLQYIQINHTSLFTAYIQNILGICIFLEEIPYSKCD